MNQYRLTKHFVDNWKLRVSNGVPPVHEVVRDVIRGSVRVQRGRRLVLSNGEAFTVLTLYWNTALNIVITADPVSMCFVSVLTDTMMDGEDTRRKKMNRNTVVPGYVAMTAHGLNMF